MKYFLHPLIGTEYDETAPLFLLRSEGNTSIVIGHEDIPEIARVTNSYLRDGSHNGALSWPEYKEAEQSKLITITEALSEASARGIKTPTDRAIRKWIMQGKLAAQKVGRTWQFEENEFFALIEAWEARIQDAKEN